MEQQYWIGRERAAMAMAEGASTSMARLIHYDLAGRYSVRAAQCPPAFMLAPTPQLEAAPLLLNAPPGAIRAGDPHRRGDPS